VERVPRGRRRRSINAMRRGSREEHLSKRETRSPAAWIPAAKTENCNRNSREVSSPD